MVMTTSSLNIDELKRDILYISNSKAHAFMVWFDEDGLIHVYDVDSEKDLL